MKCTKKCPRQTKCKPISNIVSEKSFVCICLHNESKEIKQDIFRHCFKSEFSDSCFDYDEYDLKSVICVMSEALFLNSL
jgi:hypothetical protein